MEYACGSSLGAAAGQTNPALEIDREMAGLHGRLNTLDTALSQLASRLSSAMRESEPNKKDGDSMTGAATHLGKMIRSASDRVGIHTEIVADILHRLEI